MSDSVTVKYKTEKTYCSCCNQALSSPVVSKEREYEINKDDANSWTDWDEAAEFPEDMDVYEFVYEAISFHTVDSMGYERLIIQDSEVEKVKSWILDSVISKSIDSNEAAAEQGPSINRGR